MTEGGSAIGSMKSVSSKCPSRRVRVIRQRAQAIPLTKVSRVAVSAVWSESQSGANAMASGYRDEARPRKDRTRFVAAEKLDELRGHFRRARGFDDRDRVNNPRVRLDWCDGGHAHFSGNLGVREVNDACVGVARTDGGEHLADIQRVHKLGCEHCMQAEEAQRFLGIDSGGRGPRFADHDAADPWIGEVSEATDEGGICRRDQREPVADEVASGLCEEQAFAFQTIQLRGRSGDEDVDRRALFDLALEQAGAGKVVGHRHLRMTLGKARFQLRESVLQTRRGGDEQRDFRGRRSRQEEHGEDRGGKKSAHGAMLSQRLRHPASAQAGAEPCLDSAGRALSFGAFRREIRPALFRTMSRRFVLPAVLVFSALIASGNAQEVLDGIAAVVIRGKDDIITFSQVRDLVGPMEKAARDQYKGEELVEKIKEIRLKAINDLIDRQLILQEFKKQKFNIPDHFLDERMATIIREEFGGDRAAFIRTLAAQGFTLEKFKQLETDKMIVQAMRGQNVEGRCDRAREQDRGVLPSHRDEFTSEEQIKLRMIAIKKARHGRRPPRR